MSEVEAEAQETPEGPENDETVVVVKRRRRWPLVLGLIAVVIAVVLAVVWSQREDIARDLISARLKQMDLPATYEIVSIGVRHEVVRNVVIGDPHHPDMTIEQVDARITTHWGAPTFGRITLVKPRLYGAWRNGKLSFGSLDAVLNKPSTGEPFRLPDLDLAIVDGRARIDGDLGPVGLKVEGQGALRDGFAGTIAAIAPKAALGSCAAERLSLYGKVEVASEKPHFVGPLRVAGLSCPPSELQLGASAIQLNATIDKGFDGVEGKLGLAGGKLRYGGVSTLSSGGSIGFTFRNKALTSHYDLTARQMDAQQVAMATLSLQGTLRAADGFRRLEVEGNASGTELRPGANLAATLAGTERSGRNTLAGPLLTKLRNGLAREGRGSRLSANFILRRTGGTSSIVVPAATVIGGSGQTVLAISRFQSTSGGGQVPTMTGNFATGGEGLPQIAGRMERQGGGQLVARLTMAEYAAGSARIALPEFTLAQRGGAIEFAGSARLGGALPEGEVRNLVLPLDGGWTQAGGLQVWRHCEQVHFDALSISNLALSQRAVMICPAPGRAIVTSDGNGLRVAAGMPSLDLAGRLKQTPVHIRSGPVGIAWPGVFKARALAVDIGPANAPTRLRIGTLDGRFDRALSGTFAETEFYLPAVPLDVLAASGNWQFANGRLGIGGGEFRLEDRRTDDRFQPLVSHDARVVLAGNLVTANATMLEPRSGREILDLALDHNLASGVGDARLTVPGILFDKTLQPEMVSRLTLGVIANAAGTITGNGNIHWNAQGVTSEGTFATNSLDFAAAFGPTKGLSGQIHFTDLINMVSAPDQQFHVASINPGIEVTDGLVTMAMLPGNVLAVKRAIWPFMGGTLTLEPASMTLGTSEVRHYTLTIVGLDAARLVSQIDLANINATGIFDGSLPLVFDQNGGRIEGGLLIARPPGGNVSYVGALSYKDLSTMANFAFEALKSINYREMKIEMNGALEGEIITRIAFGGLTQGVGAKRNFITNSIAKLPIRFNLSVRAPFIQLVTSLRSLYDPAYVRDPRSLGLIDEGGKPVARPPAIQPPVSGTAP